MPRDKAHIGHHVGKVLDTIAKMADGSCFSPNSSFSMVESFCMQMTRNKGGLVEGVIMKLKTLF